MRVTITGNGLGNIRSRIERLGTNSRAAGYAAAEAIEKGNRRDALAALDRFGRRMPPRKRPRRDGASGPVMSPHSTSSRRIKFFKASVTISRVGWRVNAGWNGPGAEVLTYRPGGRDVLGVSPQTQKDAVEAVRDKVFEGVK